MKNLIRGIPVVKFEKEAEAIAFDTQLIHSAFERRIPLWYRDHARNIETAPRTFVVSKLPFVFYELPVYDTAVDLINPWGDKDSWDWHLLNRKFRVDMTHIQSVDFGSELVRVRVSICYEPQRITNSVISDQFDGDYTNNFFHQKSTNRDNILINSPSRRIREHHSFVKQFEIPHEAYYVAGDPVDPPHLEPARWLNDVLGCFVGHPDNRWCGHIQGEVRCAVS